MPTHTRAGSSPRPFEEERGRLSPDEIAALRRAAQNQLVRWSRHGIGVADRDRREHLRRALHKLKTVKDGCGIRPEPSHGAYPLGFREGTGS